jgi:hypothetical protein
MTQSKVERYFASMDGALAGLDAFLNEETSPLYNHDLIGAIVDFYLGRLKGSMSAWRNQVSFVDRFAISQAESGFPIFQHVLDLENDRGRIEEKLKTIPSDAELRADMVDYIFTKKKKPEALQKAIAERLYYEELKGEKVFSPLVLPRTVKLSVNPRTKRPYYIVHWGAFDGVANLPLVYVLAVEDSSKKLASHIIDKHGKLDPNVEVQLPVDGLLNPELAQQFDEFCEKNSSYGLTLSTIATNLDHDFDTLHPKQLRRFVLGPFYSAGVTSHGKIVEKILDKVNQPENAWLMTWTMQELYSLHEKPAKRGLWGGSPARDEFHINTDDLECARQGVSNFERHALVPHEAYQAIFASDDHDEIFNGYETHILAGGNVISHL